MPRHFLAPVILFGLLAGGPLHAAETEHAAVLDGLEARYDYYRAMARKLWEQPELGYLEYESVNTLKQALADEGFSIDDGVADIPTAFTATWVPGTPAHSWQAVAAGGMSIGYKGMMVAAKTLALTAIDLFTQPELLAEAREEFDGRTGPDFEYAALLGNREPALDYRK